MPIVRRRVLVSGNVQGVFFRASARDVAGAAGVNGVARNLWDGRVELDLEGPEAAVERIIAWAHQGPRRAVVTKVEVEPLDPVGHRGFRTD